MLSYVMTSYVMMPYVITSYVMTSYVMTSYVMMDARCKMHHASCMMYDAWYNTLVDLIFERTVNIPNLSLLPCFEVAYDAWCKMHYAWCNSLLRGGLKSFFWHTKVRNKRNIRTKPYIDVAYCLKMYPGCSKRTDLYTTDKLDLQPGLRSSDFRGLYPPCMFKVNGGGMESPFIHRFGWHSMYFCSYRFVILKGRRYISLKQILHKHHLNLFFRLPDTLQNLQINLLILDWMPSKKKVPNYKWEEHKMCCNLQCKIVEFITIVPLKLKTGHKYFLIELTSWNKYFTWE